MSDKTKETERQQGLQAQLAELERLYNTAPIGLCLLDTDLRYVHINEALADFNGRPVSEHIGRGLQEIIPDVSPFVEPLFRQVLETGAPYRGIELRSATQGEPDRERDWLIDLYDYRSADGVIQGVSVVLQDITERKQAEEALQWHTGLLKRAEALAHVGHWHLALPSGSLEWSDEIYRIHGVEPGDIELTLEYGINAYLPEDRDRVSTVVQEAIEQGKDFELELRIVHPDGSIRHVASWGECGLSEDGEVEAVFGVFQDITERKQAEEQIQQLNEDLMQRALALETANEELEAFAYSVSHDLRSPLRAIDGFAALFVEDYGQDLPPDASKYLDLVQRNARQMGQLIDDLLTFSRLGRRDPNRQRVNIEQLAREVLSSLLSNNDDAPRVASILGDLPPCQADPALLRQVLTNLLSNALKFSRGREAPRIEVGAIQQAEETLYYVRDNGVGFDMAYADKLFEVFERLHLVDEYEGTGVGLAVAKRIIDRHGGRIWAEAALDEGATFYFSLG